MYIHELRGEADKLIVNSHGQFVVVTPCGAIFENFFTSDLRNICIAFGRLFDNNWREATAEEFAKWEADPVGDKLLSISWNKPALKPEPKLRLVKDSPRG